MSSGAMVYSARVTFSATATSTATGNGPQLTGSISFTLDGTAGAAQLVDSRGTVAVSYWLPAGWHTLTAHYGGDANYTASTSASLSFNVSQAISFVSLSSNPPQMRQPVAIRAAPGLESPANATATGTVDFVNGSNAIAGCSAVPIVNDVAICNTVFPEPGTFTITATYPGNANTRPSSNFMQLTVARVVAGTYLAAAPEAPVYGAPLTLNALLLSAPDVSMPTGTVTFMEGSAAIGSAPVNTDGRASIVRPAASEPPLAAGSHSLVASYGGDAKYQPSSSTPLALVVAKAPTSLVLTAGAAQSGQPVPLTAAVSLSGGGTGTLGGKVTFYDATTVICGGVAVVDGAAVCSPRLSQVGDHALSAYYNGDRNTLESTGDFRLTVNRTAVTITAVATPLAPVFGGPVTLSAVVQGAEGGPAITGTVTFSEGSNPLGTATLAADGRASITVPAGSVPPLSVGTHTITTVYNGDANNQSVTATPLAVVVAKAATTTSLTTNGVQAGRAATLSASVAVVSPGSASPAGTVDFTSAGQAIAGCTAAPLAGGVATCNTTFPSVENLSLGARYSGDANTNASSTTVAVSVSRSAAVITATATPEGLVFGAPVTIAANVTGSGNLAPTGTVTFSSGGMALSPVPVGSDGRASIVVPSNSLSPAGPGMKSIVAAYSGDTNYAPATAAAVTVSVAKANTNTKLTAVYGSPFTAVVTVVGPGAGTPTGTVQFFQNGGPIGSGPLVAVGSNYTATVPGGTYSGTVWAVYQGDPNFNGSPSQTVLVAPPAQVSLTADRNPANAGQAVALTVKVTGSSGAAVPAGSVQVLDGGAVIASGPLSAGQATFTVTLSVGSHNLTANYSGDDLYPAGSANLLQVITRAAPTVSLTSSATSAVYGQPVILTARLTGITPAAGMSVQFLDGATALNSAPVSSETATLTVSSLAVGSHEVTANWAGDSNSAPATSPAVNLSIAKARTSTTVSITGTTLTAAVTVVAPGGGSPTGIVRFLNAATNALLATAALAAGSSAAPLPSTADPIVAVYSGDSNFQGSTSTPATPASVANSASYSAAAFAPDEIVTIFGSNLASATVSDGGPANLLGGTSVEITDSMAAKHPADLLFASPTQVSFLIPSRTAAGPGTVSVVNGNRAPILIPILVAAVAPGLFTMNGTGKGAPAGQIIRVHANGTQDAPGSPAVYDKVASQWYPAPIDMGAASDSVYLVLYGTGFRHKASMPACTIAGQSATVVFAGAQGSMPGLDQVNLLLPRSLRGAGTVELRLVVDGVVSNAVTLAFQ